MFWSKTPISRRVHFPSGWSLRILLLEEYKFHNRNGLRTIRPCYLAAELDVMLLNQSTDQQKNLICENTVLSRCPAQITEETPFRITNYLQPPHLPLHDLSLSIRSIQQYTGVGKKPKHSFKKNALQCTDISLMEKRKNKQQMLVTLLSTLLEGIQIYCA